MYSCPSCGSNIKFNIASQDMYCEYCNTHHSPCDFKRENDAISDEYFDSIVYTCPQCGGQIISADEEVTAYCSYCGSSNVLTGKLKKERKPKYIIPFKITKEECIEIYNEKVKDAKFSPSSAKTSNCIDRIKPIYMPYYLYHIRQTGNLEVKGRKKMDEEVNFNMPVLKVKGDVYSEFPEIPYEASALFYDSLSHRIEPYDLSKKMKFSPVYLSGFYADIADVDTFVYENDAMFEAKELTIERIESESCVNNLKLLCKNKHDYIERQLKTECVDVETAYFPVWLFSYKHGKKVSYAAINGETGKIAADMPISISKYLGCSLIMTLVFAMLLSIFIKLPPSVFLSVFSILVVFSNNMLINEMIDTVKKEQSYKDKGLIFKRSGKKHENNKINMEKTDLRIGQLLLFCLISPASFLVLFYSFSAFDYIIIAIGAVVCFARGNKLVEYRDEAKGFPSIVIAFLASVVAALILFIDVQSEWMYLLGDVFCFVAMIMMIVEMMRGFVMKNNKRLIHLYRGGR